MENEIFIRNLTNYGYDKNGVANRFMNDMEFYEKCFRIFLGETAIAALKKNMTEKNYDGAFSNAHALKGLSGNLGLTPLYESICALVESLRAKNYANVTEEYREVEKQMEEVKGLLP